MPLYIAASPAGLRELPPCTWITCGAAENSAPQPLLLNLVESARKQAGESAQLLESLGYALAPSWEQVCDLWVSPPMSTTSRKLEILGNVLDGVENLLDSGQSELTLWLGCQVSNALASLGDAYGFLLCHPDRCDGDSQECVINLIRRATRGSLCVVVVGEEPVRNRARFRPLLRDAVGLSKAALPEIADAASPNGWGYLRSSWHVIQSQDPELILDRLPAYIIGLLSCAPALLYRTMVALTRQAAFREICGSLLSRIFTLTARLAVSTGRPHRFEVARRYCERSLKCEDDSSRRMQALVEYANLCASERREPGLQRAAELCTQGAEMLSELESISLRERCRIRLLNIRALVDYRRKDFVAALNREMQASSLAQGIAPRYPEIEEWATPLIQRNIAQLFALAFSDRRAAAALLQQNLQRPLSKTALSADVATLAKIYFDTGQHERVVELLAPDYENVSPEPQDPKREFYNRFLLALSLKRLGLQARVHVQVDALEKLNEWHGSDGGRQLLDYLRTPISNLVAS